MFDGNGRKLRALQPKRKIGTNNYAAQKKNILVWTDGQTIIAKCSM